MFAPEDLGSQNGQRVAGMHDRRTSAEMPRVFPFHSLSRPWSENVRGATGCLVVTTTVAAAIDESTGVSVSKRRPSPISPRSAVGSGCLSHALSKGGEPIPQSEPKHKGRDWVAAAQFAQ